MPTQFLYLKWKTLKTNGFKVQVAGNYLLKNNGKFVTGAC